MLAGYILFGFAPLFVKLARDYGWLVSHTLLARFGFAAAAVVGLSWLARRRRNNWGYSPQRSGLLFLRGLFGGLAVLCYFTAIQHLGAGKGTLLNYTHSVFANLFGFIILRHRPAALYWPCLAAALAGLWLVINPSFDGFSWAEGLGLLSGVLGGAAILTVKELRQTDNAMTIFSALTVGGLAATSAAVFFENDLGLWQLQGARLIPAGWAALLALAVLSMIGQLLFTQGYRNTSVALGELGDVVNAGISDVKQRLSLLCQLLDLVELIECLAWAKIVDRK
jgi:drug/metabolite transporter (DMT)-like permease